MNRYLLDTNACITWLRNDKPFVRRVVCAGGDHVFLFASVTAKS